MTAMKMPVLTEAHCHGADRIADVFVENFEPLEGLAVAIMVLRRLALRAGRDPADVWAALAAEAEASGP